MRLASLSLLFALAGLLQPGPAGALAQDDGEAEEKNKGLPLAASDTLSFTVTEGTWMSLDVSPDGQTIVFELLGDLYTLPIAGGAATRIMGGISFESQPALLPRRERDRVPERPQRGRKPLDRERRWQRAAGGDRGRADPRPAATHGLAELDPGRTVPPRIEVPAAGAHRRRLPDPPGRRDRGAPRRQAARTHPGRPRGAAAEPARRGCLGGRPLRLCRGAARDLQLQRAVPHLAGDPLRPRNRRGNDHHQRPGKRYAPAAAPRRPPPRVRHPPPHPDRSPGTRSRNRRGALAGERGHPRRPGIPRQPRHDARLRLHAGRVRADRHRGRRLRPDRLCDRRPDPHPVRGAGGSRGRAPALLPAARGRRPDGHRAHRALAAAGARRQRGGVLGVQPPLPHGPPGRNTGAAHRLRRGRVHARLVPGREHGRLRDLVEQRRPSQDGPRGRRSGDGADDGPRLLRRAGLESGRRRHRDPARPRSRNISTPTSGRAGGRPICTPTRTRSAACGRRNSPNCCWCPPPAETQPSSGRPKGAASPTSRTIRSACSSRGRARG